MKRYIATKLRIIARWLDGQGSYVILRDKLIIGPGNVIEMGGVDRSEITNNHAFNVSQDMRTILAKVVTDYLVEARNRKGIGEQTKERDE